MKDLEFIAEDAATMDVGDEVLFPSSLPVLAWAAGCAACMVWGQLHTWLPLVMGFS